jgi:hypothetical protein
MIRYKTIIFGLRRAAVQWLLPEGASRRSANATVAWWSLFSSSIGPFWGCRAQYRPEASRFGILEQCLDLFSKLSDLSLKLLYAIG